MKTITCDRCGKEVCKDVLDFTSICNAAKSKLFVKERNITPFITEREIDLCPACEKALRKFIFGKEGTQDGTEQY